MHTQSLERWKHDHAFGQECARPGERRTRVVVAITAATMVVEIVAGLTFRSMALLADGLHMASHALALGLSAFAYVFVRRRARDPGFSFGAGKVNALAGFTSAILLVGFALVMVTESLERFFHPVQIDYDYALGVAVLGLVVNGISVLILGGHHAGTGHSHGQEAGHAHGPEAGHAHPHEPGHSHPHGNQHSHRHAGHARRDEHGHSHPHGDRHAHGHPAPHGSHGHAGGEDHNLRSAYLHVLADALTSLLAILALVSGKYLGLSWLDALMGVLGAILVANWSRGLIRQTSRVLLDRQGPPHVERAIRSALEESDTHISDLHVWSVGPGIYAAEIALIAQAPQTPDHYKGRLPGHLGLVHVNVEIHQYPGDLEA